MKSITTKTFFSLVILVSHFPSQAIEDSTANMGTAFVALLCAGSGYKIIQDMPGQIHPAA